MTIVNNPKVTDMTLKDLVAALLLPHFLKSAEKSVAPIVQRNKADAGKRAYEAAEQFLKHRP